MVKQFMLKNGEILIMDSADYERCVSENIKIYIRYPKAEVRPNFIAVNTKGHEEQLGRYLLNLKPEDKDKFVLYRNPDDYLDFTRSNLLIADPSFKSRNAKPKRNGTSMYKGVSLDPTRKRKKWVVQIRRNGKKVYCKRFESEIEAALDYNRAVQEIDGEKGLILNVIEKSNDNV